MNHNDCSSVMNKVLRAFSLIVNVRKRQPHTYKVAQTYAASSVSIENVRIMPLS